ncbi:hypothetical protein VSS74_31060 [Conexibacter stalactiti]|uniref:Uncharacterized protein n=1 Tax=Conexibacter stalactiti TaxID=1940611 RepID=A0ABU4I0E9_9ACTN|nr:hypothetical protein [Conexibacter stalactiti]MDW5598839.1 hypothetical protein [Conexibacter stalactiti]MEC5039481.1 hypothetical protein [Conexibacter stalactiti]
MNIAYKHLDAKLRIAELSVGQWIAALTGLGLGIVWGVYLSPLPPTPTLVSAIYFGTLPAIISVLSNLTSVSPAVLARSALGWRRRDGRFTPGPGDGVHGYRVVERRAPERDRGELGLADAADLSKLWETAR